MNRSRFYPLWATVGGALLMVACQTPPMTTADQTSLVQKLSVDGPEAPAPTLPAVKTFYVDAYGTNATANKTKDSNAALNLLSRFEDLWTSAGWAAKGTDFYKNGTKKNIAVLSANISYVAKVTNARTPAQTEAAYLDDRRNQSYSTVTGLGPLAPLFYAGTGMTTTITSVPEDALTKQYDDGGAGYDGAALPTTGPLYDAYKLIETVRNGNASTSSAKSYFNYARPWRMDNNSVLTEGGPEPVSYTQGSNTVTFATYSSSVKVVPALLPVRGATAATDGGFPSGHTNAAYLTALSLAYAVPERFQELLARASDLGNNRILAGQHSPLDVMGGRVLATATTAANLNDPAKAAVKAAAFSTAHTYLKAQTGTTDATFGVWAHTNDASGFADWATNKANYLFRLTYGFPIIGATNVAAVVPKGAEVLLETRLPYLGAAQRREVLRTTALTSGYPLLDDAEGWGRLNLFAAADGYASLAGTVVVTMDASLVAASQNNFYAYDTWRNDIDGAGRLVKKGSGTLVLAGANRYTGGTRIEAGALVAQSASALGAGDVYVQGGSLVVAQPVNLAARYVQGPEGTLEVTGGAQAALTVRQAAVAGTLVVNLAQAPAAGTSVPVVAGPVTGSYSSVVVKVAGTPVTGFTPVTTASGLVLTF